MTLRRLFLLPLICMLGTHASAVAETRNLPLASPLRVEGEIPPLGSAIEWINTPPLTVESLRGKVVLVDFWTYSCINWRRTAPYVRAWAERYKEKGLVVIGVHSPEFDFEKNMDNVRWAVKDSDITYPVAVDSNHAIWRAFRNDYWPALYFVDAQGRIRHHQYGEGEYDQSEKVIQQLLLEAGAGNLSRDLVEANAGGVELAADWKDLRSPENYLGYERTENFVSREGTIADKHHRYAAPSRLWLNHWALAGDWNIGRQAITLDKPAGRIIYRFHARDLNVVMGPSVPGVHVRFRVLLDGQPPSAAHGVDVDPQGNGALVEQRMYQLIRQPQPVAERQIEIEFLDSGAEVFSFTFG